MSIDIHLPAFAQELSGDLIDPSDEGYQHHKTVFYDMYNRRQPLAIVRVADADDVAKTVRFAQETRVELAVRAGGHSVVGHSSSDGGLLVDLSSLSEIDLDLGSRTAWAGGGVLAGDYTRRTSEHGLVTGFGDTPSVGVAGITLGGGVGFLHRKLGLTIDSLLGAEIVTADGRIRTIDADHDADLFWAIRGGGGNFGVVTKLHYRLHPVATVTGGMLILPASPSLVTNFVTAAREASDDLSVIGAVAIAPPLPFLPEEVHGEMVMLAMMVHAGPPSVAEEEVGRFRKLATPLVDGLEVMQFPAVFGEEEPPHPAAMSVRSIFSDDLSLADAEAAMEALATSDADMSVLQIRVLGGAVARVEDDETAFAHRQRAMILNVAAAYQDPGRRAEHEAWVSQLSGLLQRGAPGAYINFLGDDSADAVRAAYPEATWNRLVDVKTRYDPQNVFSSNHNIAPLG